MQVPRELGRVRKPHSQLWLHTNKQILKRRTVVNRAAAEVWRCRKICNWPSVTGDRIEKWATTFILQIRKQT